MKHIKPIEEFLNEQLFGNTYGQFLDLLGLGGPEDVKDPKPSIVDGSVKFSGSGDKGKNIQILIDTMKKHGITNPYTQIAILGVIGKESNYIPKIEKGYENTSPERIRKIFGSRVSDLSDDEINQIKKDDEKFFDLVYGHKKAYLPCRVFQLHMKDIVLYYLHPIPLVVLHHNSSVGGVGTHELNLHRRNWSLHFLLTETVHCNQ